MHLNDLYEKYLIFDSNRELFKATDKVLKIPVNLNIYRTTKNIFRKNYNEFYKYLDEYSYKDIPFIYDAKSTSNSDYRLSENWLKNLYRKNVQDYVGKNKFYKPEHGITHLKHVNWIDNKSGIKLSDLLFLDTSNKKLFSEERKHISLNYDFLHGPKIREYAFYFREGSSFENHYSKIEYGKLKYRPWNYKDMFVSKIYDDDCVLARESREANSYRFSETEEGFEGLCGYEINIDPYHEIFPSLESKKWTTPYVSFKFADLIDQGRKEYYYYLLGDFEEKSGLSKNLVSNLGPKGGIWYVDYDNIFVAQTEGKNLLLSVNKSKLPKNTHDFLKVSTLFNFTFSFKENGAERKAVFDLKHLLSGEARILLDSENSLFSDFVVSLSIKDSKKSFPVDMISSSNKFIYFVDTSNLGKQGFMFDQIIFDSKGINEYFPSQLLSDSLLAKHFYFASGKNRKHSFSKEDLKKLNIYREFDDEEGTIRIFYYDYKDGKSKEAYLSNLKKIPIQESAAIEVNNLSEAIPELRKKLDLPSYFWDSIEFFEVNPRRLFDEVVEYSIRPKNRDLNIQMQWKFPLIKIFAKNLENLSLLSNKKYAFSKESFESLFSINGYAKKEGISLSDYKFSRQLDKDFLKFEVSLNRFGKNDRKEYSFSLVKENIPGSKLSFLGSVDERHEDSEFYSRNFFWGIAGTFFGGTLALVSLKLYPLFKKSVF